MTTTPHAQPKHVLPREGRTYRARGFLCTFKLLASDTNGAFTLSEAWEPIEDPSHLPPEGGPLDFAKITAAAQRHGIEMVRPPAH